MQPDGEAQPGVDPLLPLLVASQGGDQGAFRKLYDAARRRLFGLAMTIVNGPADAEDVVAETSGKPGAMRGTTTAPAVR